MTDCKYLIIVGTRPEAIKMAPVYLALREDNADVQFCSTGQQGESLYKALNVFNINAEYTLDLFGGKYDHKRDHHLNLTLSRLMELLPPVVSEVNPNWILVHGDTASTIGGALTAYYMGIKLAYVEAGLLTDDVYAPFPEEGHRRMIAQIADLNFAPTDIAKSNLQRIGANNIYVTGNTVVDAINIVLADINIDLNNNKPYILLDLHRRESYGERMGNMLKTIKDLSISYPDMDFIFSVHPNPNVRKVILKYLSNLQNVELLEKQNYINWLSYMRGSYFIITDSGSIQDEAPSFGVPVLILRDKTERLESVHLGYAKLIGTDPEQIYKYVTELLDDKRIRKNMVAEFNPYGDGQAGKRIARTLMEVDNGNF